MRDDVTAGRLDEQLKLAILERDAQVLERNIAAGRLRFTTDFAEAAAFADVHFICVGTPQRADGMGAVVDAVLARWFTPAETRAALRRHGVLGDPHLSGWGG